MVLQSWLRGVLMAKAGDDSAGGGSDDDFLKPFEDVIQQRAADERLDSGEEPPENPEEPPAENAEPVADGAGGDEDETQSGDEQSAGESDEGKPLVDEGREEILSLAKSYGLDPEEVASFTSREELAKSLSLLDRQLLRTGGMARMAEARRQQMLTQPMEQPVRIPEPRLSGDGQQRVPAGEPPKTEQTAEDIAADIKRLEELGYDAEIIKPLKAMYQRVSRMELERGQELQHREHSQRQAMARSVAYERQLFVQSLDEIGDEELFGTAKSATDEQRRNVARLGDALTTLRVGLRETGRDPSLTPDLVKRAYRSAFGKQLDHRDKVSRSKAAISQSNNRMGSGRATVPPKKTAAPVEGGLHPEIAKWWSENVVNPTAS